MTSSNLRVAYLVNIAARAERDLALLYEEIDAGGSSAARRWYQGLRRAILDLEDRPYIWPVIHEARLLRHFFMAIGLILFIA